MAFSSRPGSEAAHHPDIPGNAIGSDFDIQQDSAGEFGCARFFGVNRFHLVEQGGAETPPPTRNTPGERHGGYVPADADGYGRCLGIELLGFVDAFLRCAADGRNWSARSRPPRISVRRPRAPSDTAVRLRHRRPACSAEGSRARSARVWHSGLCSRRSGRARSSSARRPCRKRRRRAIPR